MEKNNNNNVSNGGIGFWGLLSIAFIVLKLCGVIKWSWIWVLSPIWIGTVAALLFLVAIILIALIRGQDK